MPSVNLISLYIASYVSFSNGFPIGILKHSNRRGSIAFKTTLLTAIDNNNTTQFAENEEDAVMMVAPALINGDSFEEITETISGDEKEGETIMIEPVELEEEENDEIHVVLKEKPIIEQEPMLFEETKEKISNELEGESSLDMNDKIEKKIPMSPPLSFGKYLTMQEKRVVVTICFPDDPIFVPYFFTTAKRIKDSYPDVLLTEKRIPKDEYNGDNNISDGISNGFDILVDGKHVLSKRKMNRKIISQTHDIYISMRELDAAIYKARRRKRPNNMYLVNGGGDSQVTTANALRLELLRRNKSD